MKTTLFSYFSRTFNSKFSHPVKKIAILLFVCLQSFSLFAQDDSRIFCPADIVQNNEPGACSAHVSFPADHDIINNPDYSVVYNYSSGAPFPVGTTRVTKQLLDQNGTPIASCSFNVTVLDKEAPVITNCPGNIAANNTANTCGAVVSFSRPTVVERCTSQQQMFMFTGSPVTFVVPQGVTSINASVKGAAGGHTYYNNSVYGTPGLGGEIRATIAVTPGQVLTLNIGGAGQDASNTAAGVGGYNGGGNGAGYTENGMIVSAGGGGGGASDIRIGGTALANRILVAGGGGGASTSQNGGNGGDVVGANGMGGINPAAGGTQQQGGAGGSYDGSSSGGSGAANLGGNADTQLYGAGGGSGYFGGGGGSVGSGAGGSSYSSSTATNVYNLQGAEEGNGLITLSYDQPATFTQTAGLPSGSVFPVGETVNTFTATDAAGNTSTCTFKVTVSDTEKPVLTVPAAQTFATVASSYTIPALRSTDNCGVSSVTYAITGATSRTGTGNDASGSFNSGTSVITYTVTDIHGNVQTGTTTVNVATKAPEIVITIPDVYAVSPGGNANTIYVGYGPSYLYLSATISGGKAPYYYTWTKTGYPFPVSYLQGVIVFLPGEYVLTVTDSKGATATYKKQIQVVDVRCGSKDDKVTVCKPGTSGKKSTTECVNSDKVDDILKKGGYLGSCTQSTSALKTSDVALEEVTAATQSVAVVQEKSTLSATTASNVSVYPNPASTQFNLQLSNFKAGKAEVVLLTPNGMAVQKRTIELTGSYQKVVFNTSNVLSGIYLIKIISNDGIQTAKVLVQH